MVEVVGDSTRDGRWALVRLAVEGNQIVGSEAEGLDRPLDGLSLLEAAAVGGDELAVDALANALAPGLPRRADAWARRRGDERRRRQRGRAAARRRERDRRHPAPLARPAGPRRRARLLLAGGRAGGTRDLPPARAAARHARPARGVPPRGGRAVRARLRGRPDAEPVHPLQRQLPLRRAARVRRARRRRAARDRPLRADRRARRAAAPRPRGGRAKGSVVHAGPARPALPRPPLVPARRAGQGRDARRGRARGPRGRGPRREPGGLLPRRGRLPRLPRAPRAGRRGRPGRRRAGQRARPPRRLLALHARTAQGPRGRGRRAALRAAQRARDERGRRRPALRARSRRGDGARATARRARARRGEAALPLACGRRERHAHRRRFSACA